jgi:hypothetical protein
VDDQKERKCKCRVCTYYKEYLTHLEKINDPKTRLFFEDMYERLCHVETDYAFELARNEDLRKVGLIN